MESIIEDYRGYEIRFNTDTESFVCDIDDSRSVKKSYPALKKFIDEFIKDNYEFKAFTVEGIPSRYNSTGKRKIIGIRKDGRFIYESDKGKQEQFSEYDLDRFMLIDEENDEKWLKLSELTKKISDLQKQVESVEKSFKVTTLKSVKHQYLLP